MKRTSFRQLLPIVLLTMLGITPALGQGMYWESLEKAGRDNTERTVRYYAMPKMFKSVRADDRSTIIRLDKEELITIDPTKKTYSVLTFDQMEAMMKRMGGGPGAMNPEMKAKLDQMPPDQRKMVEDMMKKNMGGGEDAKYTVDKTSDTKTIAGFKAVKYDIKRDDKDFGTVWATKDISGFEELKNDFKSFQTRLSSMLPGAGRAMAKWMEGVDGFPLETHTEFMNSTVTKVEKKSTPASAFDIPEGYKKVDMMHERPGRMGRPGEGMNKENGKDGEKDNDKDNDDN